MGRDAMRTAAICMAVAWTTSTAVARASPAYVACIGDSITQGVGASSSSTDWVSDLATLLGAGVTVGNYGVSSTTMMKQSNFSYWDTGDLAMVETFVANAGPNADVAIIIMLGTNDSKDNPSGVDNWTSTAPMRYAADYNAMLDELLGVTPKPEIFLALPPPAFANTDDIDGAVIADQIIPIITGIATERQLAVIDVHSALAGMSVLFPDGVHPNDMGHMLIATTMENGLLSPAIPPPDAGLTDAAALDDAASPDDAAGLGDAATSSDAAAPFDASVASDAASIRSNDGGVLAEAGAPSEDGGVAGSGGGSGCGCATTRSKGSASPAWSVALAIIGGVWVRRRRVAVSALGVRRGLDANECGDAERGSANQPTRDTEASGT